jgi:hypothetical protein
MRKNAGFIVMTLLLLIVPALANAWTLAVKVAGGTVGNNVAVSYTYKTGTQGVDEVTKTATNVFYSTSSYMYPIGPVTVLAASGAIMTLDGQTVVNGTLTPTSGNHTLTVTYEMTQATFGINITQDPNGGGLIYAENKNNTWTSTAVTGLTAIDTVPVAIAADANHKILSYDIGLGPTPVINGAAGQVLSLTAAAGKPATAVTATFGIAGKISASLFTPTAGTTGSFVNCTVTATTNDDPANLRYAFAVTGQANFSRTATADAFYSFKPTVAGTYYVTATVTTTTSGGTFTTPVATIVVANAQVNANQGCVSCHSTSFPAIVAAYDQSIHPTTCVDCHTVATPHSAGINSINIDTKTFAVKASSASGAPTTVIASLGGVGYIFCANCHNGTTLNYTTSHASLPKSSANCSSCHVSVHNPNPFLGGATALNLIDSVTTNVSTFSTLTPPALPTPAGPKGITTDGTDLYIADFDNNVILKVVASGASSVFAGSGSNASVNDTGILAAFSQPAGITSDGTNLYVCDTGTNKIRKVVISTGVVTTIAGTGSTGALDGPGLAATFNYPYGITTDGTNLYVTDFYNQKIRQVVMATGYVTTIQASVPFNGPSGITTDGTKLYVTDQSNNTISVVIATGEVSSIAAGASFSTPAGITTDGTNLFVADWGDNTIRKVVIATGAASIIAGTGSTGPSDGPGNVATFNYPFGITNDGVNLYVTDYGNHVVRKLSNP